MNSFNTLGYHPQMSSPNQPTFYYDPMNPAPYLQYSPDYRDHNQDDSDSSEHNKSVQVESEEEEEEPVRRTGKKPIGRKHRPSVGPMKKRLRWPDLG
ncbi:hypothetical protein R6Q57_012577 [Mikania cordata]